MIIGSERVLARDPGVANPWHRARAAALKAIRANPEASYAFHASVTGFPIDVVRASSPLDRYREDPFPARGLELLASTKAFLVSEKLAQTDFDIAVWQVGGR